MRPLSPNSLAKKKTGKNGKCEDWNAIFAPPSQCTTGLQDIRVMSPSGESFCWRLLFSSSPFASSAFHFLFPDLWLSNGWINKGLTGEQCIYWGRKVQGQGNDRDDRGNANLGQGSVHEVIFFSTLIKLTLHQKWLFRRYFIPYSCTLTWNFTKEEYCHISNSRNLSIYISIMKRIGLKRNCTKPMIWRIMVRHSLMLVKPELCP